MPIFQYSGRDSSGALVTGNIDAGSPDDVASQLFGEAVTPIEIKEVSQQRAKAQPRTPSRRKKEEASTSILDNLNALLARKKIEIDDLIMFSRQMYSLTKAGLPMDRAIKGLKQSLTNPMFRDVLDDVLVSLENGQTLATSLGHHPDVFSQLYLSLVHVGENTGRLDLAFHEIGRYLVLEKETRKQIKSATRYPIFVMSAMVAAVAVVTVWVIPVFAQTFERLSAELPWQTVALITMSDFVINYWPIIVGVVAGSVFAFRYWVRTERGLLEWDRRKLKFPLMGIVFERVALARFARTFAMVMKAGLPIVQGLTVVSGAVGNTWIAKHVNGMREGVERGESLLNTATSSGMFSPLVLQMIAVGEETGTVDELLSEVADFYDAEVEYDIKKMSDSVEPILIVFLAGLVLILALGVFLPIWDLNTAVNG